MWVHNLNPTLLALGPLEVRWYGIAYVLGFIFGGLWLYYYRREVGLNKDGVYDLLFYLMLGVIIGSRLFHVVFWQPAYYLADPIRALYFWEGGMAYHGGLVGILVVGWWYCRRKGVHFLRIADALSIPALFALALGRVANFINAEIIGRVTTVSWCVDYGDGLCRHPYTIYSAAKRVVVAGMLLWVAQFKVYKDGFLFFLMIFLIGIGRFWLDFYREDVLYYSLSVGQWMSLGMIAVGLVVLLGWYRKEIRKLFK